MKILAFSLIVLLGLSANITSQESDLEFFGFRMKESRKEITQKLDSLGKKWHIGNRYYTGQVDEDTASAAEAVGSDFFNLKNLDYYFYFYKKDISSMIFFFSRNLREYSLDMFTEEAGGYNAVYDELVKKYGRPTVVERDYTWDLQNFEIELDIIQKDQLLDSYGITIRNKKIDAQWNNDPELEFDL